MDTLSNLTFYLVSNKLLKDTLKLNSLKATNNPNLHTASLILSINTLPSNIHLLKVILNSTHKAVIPSLLIRCSSIIPKAILFLLRE